MDDRKEFANIRSEYWKNNDKRCSKCGSTNGIELHHKTELVNGGTNDFSNLIPLCGKCHCEIHNKNRSYLTRLGIEKARNKEIQHHLISIEDFANKMEEADYDLDKSEILDVIFSLRIRRTI